MTTKTQEIDAGVVLYERMKREFDYSQINWTIRRYNDDIDEAQATELIDAFLQWISLAPLNTQENYLTMFQTPVEEAFHCFVLNTRLYQQFCDKFLGFFFHHDPVVDESGPEVVEVARYTVQTMQNSFGDGLHPELKDWKRQFEDETYTVACVGPGGHC
jgi:hypothetical protein